MTQETTRADAGLALADAVMALGYEDIPEQVVRATKRSVLDSLGVILAASTQGSGCKEIAHLVRRAGGAQESTVLAFGDRVPCWMAGLANGAMMHALDYDDVHVDAGVHPSNATLPAALAIAEYRGKVSGRDFIAALALANELVCRVGLSINNPNVWQGKRDHWNLRLLPQTVGILGAAAAAGKLLDLSREQMVSALGIASQQAAGTIEVALLGGCSLRGLYAAPNGMWGPLAALMAQQDGITGPSTWLEGRAGLYNVHFGGLYDRDSLLSGLGETYVCADTAYKPWPTCAYTHSFVDATLRIMRRDIHPQDVAGVTVTVDEITRDLCEPLEMRRNPPTSMDAKWSIPFTVACAITKGKITLSDVTPEAIRDPAVLQLAGMVSPRFSPSLASNGGEPSIPTSALVEVRTRDGKTMRSRVDRAYGHATNPMTDEDLRTKFRECASFSVKSLPDKRIDELIEIVDRLETVDDVSVIAELLG